MFGRIKYINNNMAFIENTNANISSDLMNTYVVFESQNQKILGEVVEINPTDIKIKFLGEFILDKFIGGIIRKPLINSTIRVINNDEIILLFGINNDNSLLIGKSPLYNKYILYTLI